MSNDLQATIAARLGTTLQSLGRVEERMRKIETAQRGVNRSGRQASQTVARGAGQAGRATDQMRRKVKAVGSEMSKMGGVAGQLARNLGGGLGLGGAMGAVGIAATGAAIAVRVLTARSQERMDAIRAEIRLERQRAEAIRGAQQAHRSAAATAVTSDEQAVRQVRAMGGQGAVGVARQQSERLGVSMADMAGVQRAVGPRGNVPMLAQAAAELASTGLIDFGTAVERLSERGPRAMASPYALQQQQARILSEVTGQRHTQGSAQAVFRDMGRDPTFQNMDRARSATQATNAALWPHGGSAVEGAAREALSQARTDPVMQAQLQQFQVEQEQLDELRKIADGQGRLSTGLAELGRALAMGSGSAERRFRVESHRMHGGGGERWAP